MFLLLLFFNSPAWRVICGWPSWRNHDIAWYEVSPGRYREHSDEMSSLNLWKVSVIPSHLSVLSPVAFIHRFVADKMEKVTLVGYKIMTFWPSHFFFYFIYLFFFYPPLPSAVFTMTNLLVVAVELDADEREALDVVPLVTTSVLNEQQLVVGVVVVVDPGVVPINSRGEKQRMHLRDGFLGDQLDPIYVAYNM